MRQTSPAPPAAVAGMRQSQQPPQYVTTLHVHTSARANPNGPINCPLLCLSPYLSIALLHFSRSWQLLRAGSSLAIFLLPLANPSPLSHASRLPHLPFQSIPSTELTRRNSPEGKKCNWYFSHPPFPLTFFPSQPFFSGIERETDSRFSIASLPALQTANPIRTIFALGSTATSARSRSSSFSISGQLTESVGEHVRRIGSSVIPNLTLV